MTLEQFEQLSQSDKDIVTEYALIFKCDLEDLECDPNSCNEMAQQLDYVLGRWEQDPDAEVVLLDENGVPLYPM